MIKKLKIENFKSHKSTELLLNNLTVLVGSNGVGKSSIIQSLLILRQSFFKNALNQIELNNPLCYIGGFEDALYQGAESENIVFELEMKDGVSLKFSFISDLLNSNSAELKISSETELPKFSEYELFNSEFQYLSASRFAARTGYSRSDYEVKAKGQLSFEKGQGELVAHFLSHYGAQKVHFEELYHPDTTNNNFDLLRQTIYWEREISKNINIIVKETGGGFDIKYSFDRKNEVGATNEFLAENVGFGISYVLPVIVAILSAKRDTIIIIENPEAHLNPRAQSKLSELIAIAAQCGIQMIIETHSDHILNGLLVAIKKFETLGRGIKHDNLSIYFFDRDEKNHSTMAQKINVGIGGRIETSPEGFFDQITIDRKFLMGF